MKILPTIGPETIKVNNLKYLLIKTNIERINGHNNKKDSKAVRSFITM